MRSFRRPPTLAWLHTIQLVAVVQFRWSVLLPLLGQSKHTIRRRRPPPSTSHWSPVYAFAELMCGQSHVDAGRRPFPPRPVLLYLALWATRGEWWSTWGGSQHHLSLVSKNLIPSFRSPPPIDPEAFLTINNYENESKSVSVWFSAWSSRLCGSQN